MLAKKLLTISLISSVSSFILSSPAYARKATNTQLVTQASITDIETNARNIIVKVHVGDNRASGVLVANDDNTYTVITNAHVVNGVETFNIETPDGIQHNATLKVKDGKETGNDLAILEFNSNEQYHTAKLRDSSSVRLGDRIIAAGFPYNKQNILISDGNISLITDKPLKKGYQIGFTNETIQGMSGGILLNEKGEVIGILGKGKDALFDTAYDYQDGTQPNPQDLATMRKAAFSVPISKISELSTQLTSLVKSKNKLNLASTVSNFSENTSTSNSTTQTPKPQYTGIVKKVDDIAEQITVRIDFTNGSGEINNGSGVIIAKQDNTYYVATARHLITGEQEYRIVTPNGSTHQLDNSTRVLSEAYDFAVFSFESENDYPIATIGDFTVAANHDQVSFVSGFPNKDYPKRIITGGKIRKRELTQLIAKESNVQGLNYDIGQGLLYSNLSFRGMSGGGVFDRDGKLVGINVGSEEEGYDKTTVSVGFSFGVPITDIFSLLETKTEIKTEWLDKDINSAMKVNNQDWKNIENQLLTIEEPDNGMDLPAWMNYGNQLWRYEKYNEAIKALEKVIEIDPNFDQAYYLLGLTYWSQRNNQKAVTALTKATEISSLNFNSWRWLGSAYGNLRQYDLAISAYDEAIQRRSEDFVLYQEKGSLHIKNNQYSKALESYKKAILINSEHPWNYYNRGVIYHKLEQHKKASQDLIKFISFNPEIKQVDFTEIDSLLPPLNNNNSSIKQDSNSVLFQANNNATALVEKVNDIAKKITVRIDDSTGGFASGVIIAKKNNIYYVLAARHAIYDPEDKLYEIITPDGKIYKLDKSKIVYLSDSPLALDMAVLSFESESNYTIATIGEYEPNNSWIFTSGFKTNNFEKGKSAERVFTGGRLYSKALARLVAKDSSSFVSLRRGLIYTNMSYSGMSGGAILDSEGKLIGINIGSESEVYIDDVLHDIIIYNNGLSLGESISEFLNKLRTTEIGLQEDWLNIKTDTPIKLSTTDIELIQNQLLSLGKPNLEQNLVAWLNYGNQLWRFGRYSEAVTAFKQAIEIDPTFANAYYSLGLTYLSQQEWQKSLDTFKKAKEINPKYYPYWRYLGLSHNRLRNYRKSLNAYTKAINFKPDDFVLYLEQGNTLRDLKRYNEAVSVYGKAIGLNPHHPWSYYNRGIVHYEMGNYDEASADFIKAISLNAQIKTIR